jgi:hypothetical protein
MGRLGHLHRGRAAAGGGHSTLNADLPHPGEIDDQFSLQGEPRQVMPTTPDRQRQAARRGGSDGGLNVVGVLAKDDDARAAGDGGIEDMPCRIVGWAGREHLGGIQLSGEHLDGLCDAGVLFMRHRDPSCGLRAKSWPVPPSTLSSTPVM